MEFRLPTNLQTKLVAYDPQLKALARTQKQSTTKKSKYPLGNPVDLIPNDIIPAARLQDAIDDINQEAAPSRYREFTKVTDAGTITHAILYHYESVWYAAWLPPSDKKADYIYGYTYAYKDTDTTRKALPYTLRTGSTHANDACVSKPSGRCTFVTYTQQVTKQDVIDGRDTRNWNIPGVNAYAKKSRRLHEPIKRFETQVQMSIPQWEDSRTIFERIKTTCIADLLTRSHNTDYWINRNKAEWLPSVDNVFNFIKEDGTDSAYNIIDNGCSGYTDILHILDTPFFRKWIQNKCNESIELFNNPDNDTKAAIIQPWNTIFHLCKQIKTIHYIWGDKCPLDYYQTNLDALLGVIVDSGYRTKVSYPWLVQHMPVASFFTWINKFYETKEAESNSYKYYYKSTAMGLHVYDFRELEDTLSMVTTVLEDKGELAPPKRWRITEFHDYVQAEAWKVSNVNEGLPQDLFPGPVKVQHNEQQWTFIQPIDTHQLAAWGQAVRNCVGNATGYAEGVRKKQHFIVLCMIDNKPQFTVQLAVSNGMMSVNQIAGLSNARLTEEQRESYVKVFAEALLQREEVLASA